MTSLSEVKKKAIKAVKEDGRLIADVAAEYNLSSRRLFLWLQGKDVNSKTKPGKPKKDVVALQSQLVQLETEVLELRNQLKNYRIIDDYRDGRMVLSFTQLETNKVVSKRVDSNTQSSSNAGDLKKAG